MDFFRRVRTILSADLNIVAGVERLYIVRRVRSSAGLRPDGLHHHDPFVQSLTFRTLGGYDERDMGVVRLGTCIVP